VSARFAAAVTLAWAFVGCAGPPVDASSGSSAVTTTTATSRPAPPSATPTTTPSAVPTTSSSPAGGSLDERMNAYTARLHKAGDASACDPEVDRVAKDLAKDTSLSDADLEAEKKRRDTTNKGSMPHPDQGTACAIFGIQRALDRAIAERASGAGAKPK